jgi:dTDP-4-amino-4,6-dideoxygalactose transaminase
MEEIPYVNLSAQWGEEREELLPIIEKVLASGQYVAGKEVSDYENEISEAFDVEHVVAVNSGTDALVLGLTALGIGPGDEVITPPNSFIASTAAIVHTGARPVLVDVCEDQNINPDLIEASITNNTKAIMPVHLTGRMARMDAILEISNKYDIQIIEDAAQSAGSCYAGRPSGSWGTVGCFSTHPLKNLNGCGDGGFVTTNNNEIAANIRQLRNHGLVGRDTVEKYGYVSRMDEIQAAILRYRLKHLNDLIERRRANARLYRSILDPDVIFHPADAPLEFNTWHTFVIQVDRRDQLQEHLKSVNIETSVHYPVPIHLQPASSGLGYRAGDFPVTERQANRILTLPIHQNLEVEELSRIATTINKYFGC